MVVFGVCSLSMWQKPLSNYPDFGDIQMCIVGNQSNWICSRIDNKKAETCSDRKKSLLHTMCSWNIGHQVHILAKQLCGTLLILSAWDYCCHETHNWCTHSWLDTGYNTNWLL